jgi:hypothetical protein
MNINDGGRIASDVVVSSRQRGTQLTLNGHVSPAET